MVSEIVDFYARPWLFYPLATVVGLVIGSFINVVILRLPRRLEWQWRRDCEDFLGESGEGGATPPGIVHEPSHCVRCKRPIAWFENVPVVSWLALRGRCRTCGVRISAQYPAVEAVTGLLFLACALRFGPSGAGIAAMVFTTFAVAMTGIDLREQLLPDQLTLPLLWLGLGLSAAGVGVPPQWAIAGAIFGYSLPWLVAWLFVRLRGKEALGHGDFKLLAAIGAWTGVVGVGVTLLVASLAGVVIAGGWLALRRRGRDTPMPFGPFLAAGGWLALLWGAVYVRDMLDAIAIC